MGREISERVVAETKLCERGFRCLSDGAGCLHQAERLVPGGGVFVRIKKDPECPYAREYEDGYACSCPVRVEMFRKYGL